MTSLVVDPADPAFHLRDDLADIYRTLRAEAPVFEYAPGCFAVSRYHDIREISRDPERFCSGRGVLVNDPMRDGRHSTVAPSVIFMDPPEHGAHRKIVSRRFTPRAVRDLEPRIRAMARESLDAITPGEVVDVVEQVAVPLPVWVIADLLGVPQDARSDFRRWSDAMIEAADYSEEKVQREIVEFFDFLGAHVDATRGAPGDDVVSALVTAQVDGRALTDDEMLSWCMTLLVAGNETTRHLISGGVALLASHPEQHAMLAERPSLVAGAVEEMLRVVTPVKMFARTATLDTAIGDAPICEGEYVVMLYASGNRDESVFGPTADRFDVTRPTDPPHLAFGFGEHLCLGAALARLEARVLFEEFVARYGSIELVGEAERVHSTVMNGFVRLPAVLHSR